MDNVKLFMDRVKGDAAIQERLNALKGKSREQTMEAILKLAEENELAFSKEAFLDYLEKAKAAAEASGELREDELDAVAGGIIVLVDSIEYDSYGLCIA